MMITKQFRKAMQDIIMPDLTKTSTRLMETLDTKLAQVDATLASKIQEEEERAKHF